MPCLSANISVIFRPIGAKFYQDYLRISLRQATGNNVTMCPYNHFADMPKRTICIFCKYCLPIKRGKVTPDHHQIFCACSGRRPQQNKQTGSLWDKGVRSYKGPPKYIQTPITPLLIIRSRLNLVRLRRKLRHIYRT